MASRDDAVWLDVLPNMSKLGPAISKQLGGTVKQAGAKAGTDFSEGMRKSATADLTKLSDQVAAARKKEADAAGSVRVAEARLDDLRKSGRATAARLVAAEESLEKAKRNLASSSDNVAKRTAALATAQRDATSATKQLGDEGEKSSKRFQVGFSKNLGGGLRAGVSKATDGLKAAAAAGGAAAGAALVGAFMANVGEGRDSDRLAASLGLDPRQAERVGQVSSRLYRGAWGDSIADVNNAVGAVLSSIKGMRRASSADLEALTAKALDFGAAFEVDVARGVQVAGQLVNQGLAKDADQAFDLLVASSQKVPAAVREDLLDAVDEYGPFFKTLGYSGQQAFELLVRGARDGMYGIDKTGDAVKEFTIRATDMSESSKDAYKAIGLNAREMADSILAGGDDARKATDKIIDGLLGIESPSKRANTAIALFGTPLEDLNVREIPQFLKSLKSTGGGLDNTAGAAENMGATLNDNFGTRFEGWKRQAIGFAQDGLMGIVRGFESGERKSSGFIGKMESVGVHIKDVTEWAKENETAVKVLGVAFGATAALVLGYNAAVKVAAAVTTTYTVATKVATVAVKAFNLAMRLNPIGLVVTAIALLVVGVIKAYKEFEWFRKIVDGAWRGIKTVTATGVRAIVGFFLDMADSVLGSAEKMLGWMPGIGGKVKKAVEEFRQFKDGVNRQLAGIENQTVTVRADLVAGKGINQGQGGTKGLTLWADGGVRESHTAQIAKGGEMRLWAEPETGGEAYIPLAPAKRARSEAILGEVAQRFGYSLEKYANGGIRDKFDLITDFSTKEQAARIAQRMEERISAGAIRAGDQIAKRVTAALAKVGASAPGPGGYVFPLPRGTYRVGGGLNSYPGHTGQDFPAPTGTPVYAPFSGKLLTINLGDRSYGRYANITAGNMRSIQAHLSSFTRGPGMVRAGEMVGRVGSTGNSTGPHLHQEFRRNGSVISPRSVLKFDTGLRHPSGGLQPGWNLSYNGTGRVEPVVRNDEARQLRKALDGAQSGGPLVNIERMVAADEDAAARKITNRLRDAMTTATF